MNQTIDLRETGNKPVMGSQGGFVIGSNYKVLLLIILAFILYFRMHSVRRKRNKICSICGHRNPQHHANCRNCSAPLIRPS